MRHQGGRAFEPHRRLAIAGCCVFFMLLTAQTGAQRPPLTGASRLAPAYDAIFDARFDDVARLLAAACVGPERTPVPTLTRSVDTRRPADATADAGTRAPEEVCQLLEVVSLWWQIQLDPNDTSRDAIFRTRADDTIAAVEAWTARDPSRAEAWFYLGGAYGARAQWRVLRGERLAAARDGRRIKESLERALVLDPTLQDAYFGIGLYQYYADVAPTGAKLLRWLLALPGGDKTKGMQQMLRARQEGQLLRDEADYQLHLIYLWYEQQPERALEILRTLRDDHPHNPHFSQRIAEVEDVYLHDHAASLRSWRRLLDAARGGKVAEPAMTEVRARLGIAAELDQLFETDAAIDQLRRVIDSKPEAPIGAAAQAALQLAQSLDRLGRREEAIAAYRAVLATAPSDGSFDMADRSRLGLRKSPHPQETLAYRRSLEGWRALERGVLADASRALSESLALRPRDQVTRYRQARLLQAQKQLAAALDMYESVISAGAETPPTFYAAACLEAARLHEQQRNEGRAIDLYRMAHTAIGAELRTKEAAARALARLSPAPSGSVR
jgi:tetratricopeptide (TPR) repeat protein